MLVLCQIFGSCCSIWLTVGMILGSRCCKSQTCSTGRCLLILLVKWGYYKYGIFLGDANLMWPLKTFLSLENMIWTIILYVERSAWCIIYATNNFAALLTDRLPYEITLHTITQGVTGYVISCYVINFRWEN